MVVTFLKSNNIKDSSEYGTISLINLKNTQAILRVIHQRIFQKIAEGMSSEKNCESEALFSMNVIAQKCFNMNQDIYACFNDFQKSSLQMVNEKM